MNNQENNQNTQAQLHNTVSDRPERALYMIGAIDEMEAVQVEEPLVVVTAP